MKRILIINHSAQPSGATDEYLRLLKYFNSIGGYTIDGIFPKGELEDTFKKYCSRISNYTPGFFPLGLKLGSIYRFITRFFKQYFQILKLLDNKTYDACILNVSVLLSIACAVKKKKIKSLVFIRETVSPYLFKFILYKILSKTCNFFIGVSEFTTKDFIRITKNENIITLYSSIENNTSVSEEVLDDFNYYLKANNLEKLVSKDHFKVICTGYIDPLKNQLQVIRAAIELKKKDQLKNMQFVFLGGIGNKDYYNMLIDLVAKEDLADNCHFLGYIDRDFVYCILENMDAFILVSLSEGFPLSIAEALKFKIPVITTKVGGIGDIIKHEQNGIITSGTVDDICESLIKIQNKAYSSTLAQNGYETYLKNFNLEENLQKVKSIIESL